MKQLLILLASAALLTGCDQLNQGGTAEDTTTTGATNQGTSSTDMPASRDTSGAQPQSGTAYPTGTPTNSNATGTAPQGGQASP